MKNLIQGIGLFQHLHRLILVGILVLTVPARAAENFNSVYISEFLADNRSNLQDEAGDYPGWIELYNGGTSTVNLAGWFLSDSPTNLAKWRFPGVRILPATYMVVFTSGKDHTNVLANLHTNFRLAHDGGYLALVGPATNVVSEFGPEYSVQSPDISFGRVSGEPALTGYFHQPTPGKPNESSGTGFGPSVAFSHPSGSFIEPFSLQLMCQSSNAVIRYTLDGRLPNKLSPIYRASISLTNTTCVRVRAYQDGLLPGPPQGATYLLLATNVRGFTSNLPVLVMDTLGSDRPTSLRSSLVHLSFHEPRDGKTSLTNRPALSTRAGYHSRGSSSAGMPQTSFAIQFLDEFDREQQFSALGLPANSDWVLYAPTLLDPGMIHNPFVHQLSRDLGHYSPRTRFLEVYLVEHPGPVTARDYYGVYVLEEKIKIGKNRVAINKLGPNDLAPPEVTGGYLLKFDRLGPGEEGFWAGGASMVYVDPKEPVIESPQRAPQRRYIKTYFDEFERVLDGPNWKDPLRGYRAYIDVDSWIDFHVLEVLSGNVDIFAFSTFFYKPRGGKITFGPHWDFDRALGSPDHRDNYPRRWNTGRFFDGPWWSRLFNDPDFWQLWVDRWQGLRRNMFSEEHLFGIIDRLADELREAQPRQVRRWGLEPRKGSYQGEIDLTKGWLSQRMDFIDRQLAQPPEFSNQGGQIRSGFQVTLSGPTNSTFYYTLNGADPRLTGGAISSNAIVYAGPITLQSNAQIIARAVNPGKRQTGGPPISTPWSSPVKANFVVERR